MWYMYHSLSTYNVTDRAKKKKHTIPRPKPLNFLAKNVFLLANLLIKCEKLHQINKHLT